MSRHHKKISSRAWDRHRRQVLDRDGWRCQNCGRAGLLEVHHPVPIAEGGDIFAMDNCVTLCRGCHIDHHRRPVDPQRQAWLDILESL